MKTEVNGTLITVKNKKMHVKVMGSGEKAIVYLPGWNEPMPTIESAPLMRELAKHHTVCAIEYFGYGLSDPTDRSHTNENYVAEIREALLAVNLKPPYILMPYSCSGIYAEYYAHKFPEEIEGIVMLDCTPTFEEMLMDDNEDLVDEEKVKTALNALLTTVTNPPLKYGVPDILAPEWKEFCQKHFSSYFKEHFERYYDVYLAEGYPKEELDQEVQDIINALAINDADEEQVLNNVTPGQWEELMAEYLPLGYTREELKVLMSTPNHEETLRVQYETLAENVKEVMAMARKIADDIPVLVFHAPIVGEEHQANVEGHLGKLGKVKKHIIVDGSDHGTITLYVDVIASEVEAFLREI